MKTCPLCATQYADDVRFCPNDGQTLRAGAPASDLVDQVIADRYHVLQKLGEGGMGQVYLAEHVKMGRRSAIKVMNPGMVHDPDAVARFNREAANASKINHSNVCAIYDFGETPDGLVYLAMEYIDGESLTRILGREGTLSVARATAIFAQVADALQAAHDLGIVHRDLKPDNIMITRGRDAREVVKVVDFGIAKAVGGDEAGQKVTKTGLVVGTPEFMSPEQLAGDKVDPRTDLYSLALVLYQMLTGRLPFEAETVQEIMVKRITEAPATLRQLRPDLSFPEGLQQTLDTALARRPHERYQQVAKFAADVTAVTGSRGGATAAIPPTRVDTEARTQVLAAKGGSPPAPPSARRVARTAPPRRSRTPLAVGAVVVLAGTGVGAWIITQGIGSGGAARDSSATGGTPTQTAAVQPQHPADTQRLANPSGGDSAARPTRDSAAGDGRGAGGTTPGGADRGGRTGLARPTLNAATVSDLLDRLIEASPAVIVDSATLVYNTNGVADRDRAFAACLVAQAEQRRGNRSAALEWARKGLDLNPTLSACNDVVNRGSS